jgi:hypothetical protein
MKRDRRSGVGARRAIGKGKEWNKEGMLEQEEKAFEGMEDKRNGKHERLGAGGGCHQLPPPFAFYGSGFPLLSLLLPCVLSSRGT